MMRDAGPSESLTWWGRAAQARRVAAMLSPQDARLAEAYAAECENQARRSDNVLQGPATSGQRKADPKLKCAERRLPRRAA
jgi:hypothetical protein